MLPALLVIVLMPIISFAMFKFMIIPMIKAELPEPGMEPELTAEDLDISYDTSGEEYKVTFEPVVTNVKGTSQTRFVQVIFSVYSANPHLQEEVDKKTDRMKDVAISVLGNLTLADLERREMKNIVRNQLKQGFNHVLGEPLVEDISFSQFVVQ
ncbi:flagellar basal body-associated FliL family protein [Pelagicoccus sp. SDUM812003]|uniref:flagellar basal body-associated FliL family protein n=1 Tax=Pelagicoccus sp. SDUM812003 TaxID=3041267 RepID=UPI00280CE4F7|nr:flagellar basal body-associated FliL family protein [Pelagicoccus sp. SDUM812003]MDQ8202539.1 flagellar basal body-associated FliL family protein [Pelagicoccus sp. SDUM812003]